MVLNLDDNFIDVNLFQTLLKVPVMLVFFHCFLTFNLNIYSVWSVVLQNLFPHSVSMHFGAPLIVGRSSWVLVTNDIKEIKNVIPF